MFLRGRVLFFIAVFIRAPSSPGPSFDSMYLLCWENERRLWHWKAGGASIFRVICRIDRCVMILKGIKFIRRQDCRSGCKVFSVNFAMYKSFLLCTDIFDLLFTFLWLWGHCSGKKFCFYHSEFK